MTKRFITACILIILLSLSTGCEDTAHEDTVKLTTLEATKEIEVGQGTIVSDSIKGISNEDLPKDFQAKEIIRSENVFLLDWNGENTFYELNLAIGKHNNAIIFFYENGDTPLESIEITTPNTLLTGYIYDGNNILLITKGNKDQLIIECYTYNGDKKAEYSFEHILATDYKAISCDVDAFYLTYKLNNQLHIDTFKISNQKVILIEKNKFRADITAIFSDKSTIFLKRKSSNGFYIDITNKQLAPLDIIKVNKNAEIVVFKYQQHGDESELRLILDDSSKVREYLIEQENNYNELYTHSILENKIVERDDRHAKHFVIYNDLYGIYENGFKCDLKYEDVFRDRLSVVNFYRIASSGFIITNDNYDVSYLLTNNYDIASFMRVNNYYVGLNENNEICCINPSFNSEVLNDKFLGEKFEYGLVFVNEDNNKLYYLNNKDNAVYSIDSNRTKDLVTNIPNEIWINTIDEGTFSGSFYADDNGLALISNYDYVQNICTMYYYNFETKLWNTFTNQSQIYYQEHYGMVYGNGNLIYIFNHDTYEFEPCYRKYHENYHHLIANDILYLNEYYHCLENDNNIKIRQSEYVPYETEYGVYHIIDLKRIGSRAVIREHKTTHLLGLTDDGYKKLFDTSVRVYDLSEEGILFTGFGNEAILYYYEFETDKVSTLYSKGLIADLAIKDNYAYFISLEDENKLIILDIHTGEETEVELNDMEISFELADNYLAIATSDHKRIQIMDISKAAFIDTIDGDSFIWHNDKLIYDCGGCLTSYNPQDKTMVLMEEACYPYPLAVYKGSIYYLVCLDGPPPLCKINLDKEINLPEAKGVDFHLIKVVTDYSTILLLYDNANKRLNFIVDDARLKYQIDKNIVKYMTYDYYNEKWPQEWKEYKVESGKIIKEIIIK